VTDADIDAAIRFVKTLAKAPAAEEVRNDLRAVERGLDAMRGLTMARAIELLMTEPPSSRRRRVSGDG
jgi:hypothetical protein